MKRYRRAHIFPARLLRHSQNIAVIQQKFGARSPTQRPRQIDGLFSRLLRRGALQNRVMHQIGAFRIRASQKSTRGTDQVRHSHIRSQRIASRPADFSPYINARWIHFLGLTVDKDPVSRFHQKIVQRVACQRFAKRNTEHFGCSIRQSAEKLCGFQPAIRRNAARLIDGVAHSVPARKRGNRPAARTSPITQ